MNKENASKLWKIIQDAGDYLMGKPDTLVHTSYADYLKFIKNKSHKDSLKTLLKLDTGLEHLEINQMVNFDAF